LEPLPKGKHLSGHLLKKICVDFPVATIEYTLPLSRIDNSNKEVLVFSRLGWPRLTTARTFKLKVSINY